MLGLSVFAGGCGKSTSPQPSVVDSTLRVGVGALPQQAPQAGLRQLVSSLALEPLASPTDDGRMRPWVLESWTTASDRLSVTLKLRPKAIFHDGSPVTAAVVVQALERSLPLSLGSIYRDVASISEVDRLTIRIDLRKPSQFIVEALEVTLQKPGSQTIGTGPYIMSGATTPATLTANANYYRERPTIDQLVVTSYPTVRAAWAELLRGNLDMLNEVNLDALDSLQAATNVNVFSYVRHYQFMIVFGPRAAALRPPEVRRELSAALDRDAIVREAMNGHGVVSTGPVPLQHWTMSNSATAPALKQLAKNLAARHLKFTCLVPPDTVYERVALAVKRQLAAVSVEMELQEATQQQVADAFRNGNFDALLGDIVSGPTLFRSFREWSSQGNALTEKLSSVKIDDALNRINHAISDDEYRAGVSAYQRAITDEPPALFIAWSERARAVSRRFFVPPPEKNGDVLNSIRLWRPVAGSPITSTN